jgi:hypothetical protein
MRKRAPHLSYRADAIGAISVLGGTGHNLALPEDASDIRLRFAARGDTAAEVEILLDEVEGLYCAGPAGGAGVRRRITPRLASASCLVERDYAREHVIMIEGGS